MCAQIGNNTDVRRVGMTNQSYYITIPVVMARELKLAVGEYVYVTRIGQSLNIRKMEPAENTGDEVKDGD